MIDSMLYLYCRDDAFRNSSSDIYLQLTDIIWSIKRSETSLFPGRRTPYLL